MLKYYFFLFLIAGIALYYAFVKDPCNQQLSMDFAKKYPGSELLYSSAQDGSPESVHCLVTYRKPDSKTVYEGTWLYQNLGNGWEFSRILETHEKK